MEKMTKKIMFERVIEVVNASDIAQEEKEVLVEKLRNEIDLINKKSSKPKVNEENIKVSKLVYEELAKFEEPVTISELINKSEVLSNYVLENERKLTSQKIQPMLKIYVEEGKVVNTKDSKNSYYKVV